MRIVIDTNLLISGVISAGLARQLMEAVKTGEFEWCTSEVLLALGSYQGIPIVTARQAMERIATNE